MRVYLLTCFLQKEASNPLATLIKLWSHLERLLQILTFKSFFKICFYFYLLVCAHVYVACLWVPADTQRGYQISRSQLTSCCEPPTMGGR